MENNFNLSSLSDAELDEFYVNVAEEISARRKQKSQRAWDKMVSAIKEYLEVDGHITINYDGEEFYINCDTDFKDLGEIVLY